MQDLDGLDETIQQIKLLNEEAKTLISKLKEFTNLKSKIKNFNFDKLKIVGVDGGFLRKDFHGGSFILCRAVAVYFEYDKGKLIKTLYFPEKRPVVKIIPIDLNLPEQEINLFVNLMREKIEIETCIAALDVFKPDILIRDGSIILYPGSLPEKGSLILSFYKEVIDLIKKLYQKSIDNNILLCGAVEDSRGKRFCKFLQKFLNEKQSYPESDLKVLEKLVDTVFLYYFLDVGEKTDCLNYSENLEMPILIDLGVFSKQLFLTYLKTSSYDRPIRIDFLATPEKKNELLEKISSIIYNLSKQYKDYSYPSILEEADICAKLNENDILNFKSAINKKINFTPFFFDLRREYRPY